MDHVNPFQDADIARIAFLRKLVGKMLDDTYTDEHVRWMFGGYYYWPIQPYLLEVFQKVATWNKEKNRPNKVTWERRRGLK